MAAATPNTLSLQARDWCVVMGVITYSPNPYMMDLYIAIQQYVKNAVTKPVGTTVVPIVTTEYAVCMIAVYLYGTSVRNVATESASTFTRVMAAIRAANNAADNYINTTLAEMDAANLAAITGMYTNGRKAIMTTNYDGL